MELDDVVDFDFEAFTIYEAARLVFPKLQREIVVSNHSTRSISPPAIQPRMSIFW